MVEFMLAKEYTKGMSAPKSDPSCEPPIGWFSSEKYDGYRARYMGEEPEQVFLSRQQKLFNAPEVPNNSDSKEYLILTKIQNLLLLAYLQSF